MQIDSVPRGLKATWSQAIATFIFPILIVSSVRWMVVEPFVIPSGSMLPNLHIHDHVLVKKFSFGMKFPFTDVWIFRWGQPKRSDTVVFKYPEKPSVYFIKRVIGLPGDEVLIKDSVLSINGEEWVKKSVDVPPGADENYDYFEESSGHETHIVRFQKPASQSKDEFKIKLQPNEYFMMGDNRDESLDSRFWGVVKEGHLVGKAWKIVIGCDETLPSNSMLCNPATLRKDRFWIKVDQ